MKDKLEFTPKFLGTSTLGMFGAGYLARAIAQGLLEAGLPKRNLAICHRESKETDQELAVVGLAEQVADRDAGFRDDGLLVSFLAGVPVKNVPVHIADTQRFRVMLSAPDTLHRHNGIAALYPADNPVVREIRPP